MIADEPRARSLADKLVRGVRLFSGGLDPGSNDLAEAKMLSSAR